MIFKYVQYLVSCDGENCTVEESDYDNCTQQEAIQRMRNDGWTFGNKHLCPDCNGKNPG